MSSGKVWWRWYYKVVLFKTLTAISVEELGGIFGLPLNHRLKILISWAIFHFNLLSPHPDQLFLSIMYPFFLFSCVSTPLSLYSLRIPAPFIPKAAMSYHQCSWQVCRHHSLQSSWWGSCTERWSVQRSLPPLQVWTHSSQQIPRNAGLRE